MLILQFAYAVLGHYDFLPYNKGIMDFLAKDVCNDISDILCENVFFVLGGFDRTHLNQVRESAYICVFAMDNFEFHTLNVSVLCSHNTLY